MSHQLLFSTTGNGDVSLKDLGITLPDPTTDFDLLESFTVEIVRNSEYLQTAITNGDATVKNENGIFITDIMDGLYPLSQIDSESFQNLQVASDESESSTTSQQWQEKLKLTTTSLPSGEYRIGWYFEIAQTNIADTVEARVELNDVSELCGVVKEVKDTSDWIPISGFYHDQSLSGVNTIDIDYRQQKGSTAKIRRARIEIWRTK
jgi:hypothetical protein